MKRGMKDLEVEGNGDPHYRGFRKNQTDRSVKISQGRVEEETDPIFLFIIRGINKRNKENILFLRQFRTFLCLHVYC